MRLFTFLVLLFGIAQTSAYSVPGGYERVLIYYLYSIDAQLNDGTPEKIGINCSKTMGISGLCTLDQLLRYIAAKPKELPAAAPATEYPKLPPMDDTAKALTQKDAKGYDFAGQINTGRALPGSSADYSKFLSQLGEIAGGFAQKSPGNADLLKTNLQAIRNTRRNAQLTSFMAKTGNSDINVATDNIPIYDGAPDDDDHKVKVINAKDTVAQNSWLTLKELGNRWKDNIAGNHEENVESLKLVLEDWDAKCS
jgi:hypothetical protein